MNCSASIVYSNSWLGQTSSIGSSGSPVSIFTPTDQALYRASVGLTKSGTGNVTFGLNLNGVNSGESVNSGAFEVRSFEGHSGTPVTLFAEIDSGSPTFDVLVCIEQLI